MKSKRHHPDKALTAVKVRTLKKPGRYADGNGLYLVVAPSGAKRWILRTVARGKRCDIGLGSCRLVPLAEAREEATAYRKIARRGGDPLAERRRKHAAVPTFEEAAKSVHAEHRRAWRNARHSAQWLSSLRRYAFPALGTMRVDHIDTPDALKVLAPIWLTRPETARRVRQRIGTVLDWAKAAGHRTEPNPLIDIGKGLPKQPARDRHHAALQYAEVPGFISDLRAAEISETVSLAFELLILTATRTGEAIGAQWGEISLSAKTWTIPAIRMKGGREFRVPLAPRCIEILRSAKALSDGSEFVFPGRVVGKPISNMAFLMALRRMGVAATAHGFRSSFRDWASEKTHFSNEVCEQALAHAVKDKVEAAYRRSDLFKKRAALMDAWASYAASKDADVITLRAG